MTLSPPPLVARWGDTRSDTPPPPGLTPDTFAARLYAMLEPLAQLDVSYGWALLILCNAIGTNYQLVEDWVRDTPEGDPGWSLLLDVDRCPPEALGWLGQLVGVRLLPGASDDDSRHRIQSTDGFKRGTLAALQGAAWRTLTGQRRVYIAERDGTSGVAVDDAYHLTVTTYASETPDPVATQQALIAQKPGGLVLVYNVQTGQVYSQVVTRYATYTALRAAYPNYATLLADEP